ncbi:MAG: hypothetical protein E6Q66_01185 [Pedobacter sp.]|nr:MAG: hypothetical protein E6Q66_01185 [Pedobacter sp.]
MQNSYKLQEGQTLLDMAAHHFGSTEAAFEIAMQSGLSLTDELPANSIISLPKLSKTEHINRYVVAAIVDRNVIPSTGINALHEFGGIGSMQVWVSFKIV